jgi:hypothetical protein
MSQKDIVAKLAETLGHSVEGECHVVYVLVELRKLLERDEIGGDFKTLKFYCDWSAHACLSFQSAKDFVKNIDVLIGKSDEESHGLDAPLTELCIELFRVQLHDCLRKYKLPTEICADHQSWQQFLRLFSLVIQDCPLSCRGIGKNIDEVVITKTDGFSTPNDLAFETKWELRLNRETTRVFDLHPDCKLHSRP